jgi:hypothetical protein
MGALRFKIEANGDFLDNNKTLLPALVLYQRTPNAAANFEK